MSLIDRLKAELGSRNVAKYFATDTNLALYIVEGIEKYSDYVPVAVSFEATMNGKEVSVPSNMKKVTAVWNGQRYLVKAKEYQVYAADTLFDSVPDTASELWEAESQYPDANERKIYGEWMMDSVRRKVVFRVAGSGPITVFGFGTPLEGALTAIEQREVLKYAVGTALLAIVPTLSAKMDIDMEGVSVKQKTAEYQQEGSRLLADFDSNGSKPYMTSGV